MACEAFPAGRIIFGASLNDVYKSLVDLGTFWHPESGLPNLGFDSCLAIKHFPYVKKLIVWTELGLIALR